MEGSISAGAPWTNDVIWNCSANFGTADAAGAQYPILEHALGAPGLGAVSVPATGCPSCGMLHSALATAAL